ncbi:MAG TPA: hypothetical protein VK859_12830 [bacterium]|nr:hypothetical protein [bacterium]
MPGLKGKNIKKKQIADQINLFRSGSVVSTFVGAFGSSLRETRLTAILGYIIAQDPKPFLDLFGFRGVPTDVRLENRHEDDRSDILVTTTAGTGLIEAKVDATDPLKQSKRYDAKWKVLLTQYVPSRGEGTGKVRYLHWEQLAKRLRDLEKTSEPKIKFLCNDLISYLGEKRMIRNSGQPEIYAREINEPITLTMFLKAQMYGCDYEKRNRVADALYFAPHFGKKLAHTHPGIRVGISYIAKIEDVVVIEAWKELKDALKGHKKKFKKSQKWLNKALKFSKPIKTDWPWKKYGKRSFLFLSTPRLVFNPPVHKEKIQKGKGWLSKRVLSFDELFVGWEK